MTTSTALVSGATQIPFDDTIPQNTEGVQMLTQAITPKHAADLLLIAHIGVYTAGASTTPITVALFQDSTANALAVTASQATGADEATTVPLLYQMQPATTSSTTFKIRAGTNSTTIAMNAKASAGTRLFGGTCYSALSVMEIFL